MNGDGPAPRTFQDLRGAFEVFRDTVIHDMKRKYSLTVDGPNEASLDMAMAREHGLLLQVGQGICGIHVACLQMREKACGRRADEVGAQVEETESFKFHKSHSSLIAQRQAQAGKVSSRG